MKTTLHLHRRLRRPPRARRPPRRPAVSRPSTAAPRARSQPRRGRRRDRRSRPSCDVPVDRSSSCPSSSSASPSAWHASGRRSTCRPDRSLTRDGRHRAERHDPPSTVATMGRMKVRIGVGLGVRTTLHGPEFGEFVDTVERLRFDSLWLSERITGEAPDPVVAMSLRRRAHDAAEVRHERARAAGPQPDRAGQGDGHAGADVRRPAAAGVRARRRRRHGAPGVRRRARASGPSGSTRRSP